MKLFLTNLFLLLSTLGIAQSNMTPTINDALQKWSFIKGEVINGGDTITYFMTKYVVKPSNLVVFIQGTAPNPIFSYEIKSGEPVIYRWFGSEYKMLDSTYAFAIIPKPGMSDIFEENYTIPKAYYEKNHLDYRVKQLDVSIDDIIKKHLQNPAKIIVYGHSEGATITAALALKNKSITHLGFWSGNVLHNFYEFSLFSRIEVLKEKKTDIAAHREIMGIIDWYAAVIENPNSTAVDEYGYTNKRWSSYEKAPIEYLLEIDIPIYAVFGTKDESTPIETAYLLPIQFMQKRKENLTFEICIGCDHGYVEAKGDEKIKHWNEIFRNFINWTNENK